jgi:hypothetical protein
MKQDLQSWLQSNFETMIQTTVAKAVQSSLNDNITVLITTHLNIALEKQQNNFKQHLALQQQSFQNYVQSITDASISKALAAGFSPPQSSPASPTRKKPKDRQEPVLKTIPSSDLRRRPSQNSAADATDVPMEVDETETESDRHLRMAHYYKTHSTLATGVAQKMAQAHSGLAPLKQNLMGPSHLAPPPLSESQSIDRDLRGGAN